jgi:hypothetical protein
MSRHRHRTALYNASQLLDKVLAAIAADRGCTVRELSTTLCSTIQTEILDWIRDLEDRTPTILYPSQIEYESEHAAVTAPPPRDYEKLAPTGAFADRPTKSSRRPPKPTEVGFKPARKPKLPRNRDQ